MSVYDNSRANFGYITADQTNSRYRSTQSSSGDRSVNFPAGSDTPWLSRGELWLVLAAIGLPCALMIVALARRILR